MCYKFRMSNSPVYEILCSDGKSRHDLYRHEDKAIIDASTDDCGNCDDDGHPCPTGEHSVVQRSVTDIREVYCSMCGKSCMHQLNEVHQEARSLIDSCAVGGYGQSFPQDGESWTINLCEWCYGAIVMVCEGKITKVSDVGDGECGDYGAIAILKGYPAWMYGSCAKDAELVKKAIADLMNRCNSFLSRLCEREEELRKSKSNLAAAAIYSLYRGKEWFLGVQDKEKEVHVLCHGGSRENFEDTNAHPNEINGVRVIYIVG